MPVFGLPPGFYGRTPAPLSDTSVYNQGGTTIPGTGLYTVPAAIYGASLIGSAAVGIGHAMTFAPGATLTQRELGESLSRIGEAFHGIADGLKVGGQISDASQGLLLAGLGLVYGTAGAHWGAAGAAALLPYLPGLLGPVGAALFGPLIGPILGGVLAGLGAYAGAFAVGGLARWAAAKVLKDPLILDLDGNGIETIALTDSNVHFNFDGNGFAVRTGWAAPTDGMLAIDHNGNGIIDDASELFGSPTQDGFAVLETFDLNHDGVINASDEVFAQLRVWQDLNSDGVTDTGELRTLAEVGISSINLSRTALTGTNNGHGRGFGATFNWTDGHAGTAETIYFQTDLRDTRAAQTPNFTVAAGVNALPQFSGSGQLYSTAYRLSMDAKCQMNLSC
jgi:hypothetical protein